MALSSVSLRQAVRSLFKPPLITLAAILSLALGIGANAAIFSLFDQMVLRPLPVEAPGGLVNVESPGPQQGSTSNNTAGTSESTFSYPMFTDLEREVASGSTGLSGLAAHRAFGANLGFEGNTLSGTGMLVSGSYFDVLGIGPLLGRVLQPADNVTPGAHPVVVLSHAYWQTRFDSDPGVLNQTMVLNGHPMTIVGVAARGFRGTTLGNEADVFVPILMREQTSPGWEGFENRKSYWVYMFGRLAPNQTADSAQASLEPRYRSLLQEVEVPLQSMSDDTLKRFAEKPLLLTEGKWGQSQIRKEASTPLLLLLCVAGFVLLISCANIANLLLAKATNRMGEIAVRMSLGAQRRQVVAQLMSESVLLSVLGALVGLLVARLTLVGLISLTPQGEIPVAVELGPVVWVFLIALVLLTSLAGLFPALHTTREDLVAAVRNQSNQTTRSRAAGRFRNGLVFVQVTLSVMLLVTAGLFIKSLVNVNRVDLGLDYQAVATFSIAPELNGYDAPASRALFERVEAEVGALPGVELVTASMVPIVAGDSWGNGVRVQGFEEGPDIDNNSRFTAVGPGFFSTFRVPLLAGREFRETDTQGAPKVAIVNESFAEKFGIGRDAVGKFMAMSGDEELDIEIVGLVQDTKYNSVKGAIPPVYYLPHRQEEELGFLTFYVRTSGDPETLLSSLRGAVKQIDSNLPVESLRTMPMQVNETITVDRILSVLSAAFAALATVLAAIGLYGVLAYLVAQRRREIGLRMALGADAKNVRGLVLHQLGRIAIPGAVVGLIAAFFVGRAGETLLFGVKPADPMVIAVSMAVLILVGLVAGLVPALKASRIDPMRALRDE